MAMGPLYMDILKGLNDTQRKAVEITDGPLLIMAGAGSGKTKVLTCKIAYLLEQGVKPKQILAITFTNKAALEMQERAEKLIGPAAQQIWLSTFHSFCAKFLRFEIEGFHGYNKNFTIYDSGDSNIVVKKCLKELNLDDKQYAPYSVQAAISNAKNMMLSPAEFLQNASSFYEQKVGEVYKAYQQYLLANNALDFDDLLYVAVELLEDNAEIREKYQNRFHYLLIDEYQDTNGTQYRLAKILAAKYHNICVVGDADQSIYGWRGADISNILNFERDYPQAKVVKLEQNYRSTKTILQAANAVIEHNVERPSKTLWTDNAVGQKIKVYEAMTEHEEARFVADNVLKQKTLFNVPYNDVAILYRTNAQSRVIEEALMRAAIPYTIVGGLKFY